MTFPPDLAQQRPLVLGLDVIRERDRIAAELQDQVIRAIFAVGLDLETTAAITADPLVRQRVDKTIGDLDAVIRLIRDTVFDLEHRLGEDGARAGTVRFRE